MRARAHTTSLALQAALILLASVFILPLVWMLATSVKPEAQAASGQIRLLVAPPDPALLVALEAAAANGNDRYTAPDESVVKFESPGALIKERDRLIRERESAALTRSARQAAANYSAVWNDPAVRFPLYLRNTLIVAALSVVGMTLSSAMVAYGLSRVKWRGRGPVFALVLATMMIPFPVIMAPLFVVFRGLDGVMEQIGLLPTFGSLRLMGTLKPLWLPAWFGGAFNIFLLRQFYLGLPAELDEAARIDGCSHWTIFWRMILPLSKPALAVVALFHFIYVWNDFLGPLIFVTDQDQFTLARGLQLYQGQAGNTPWNLLMAASAMMISPILVLFMLTQRTFVKGVAADAVKG